MRASPSSRTLLAFLALSSFPVSFAQLSIPTDLPESWEYQGCYTDVPGRTINGASYADGANMTNAACTSYCASKGFRYAGTEFSVECFCGNILASGTEKLADSECNMPCSGDAGEPCGAGAKLSLFYSSAVTGPSQPESIGDYDWYGCQTEATGTRALSAAAFDSDNMTLEACQAYCSAFTYFGVEYSRECYCGDKLNAGSVPAPASECSMTCSGNPAQYCGAGNRLSVYARSGTPPPSSTTGPGTPSSSSAPPAATGYPEGWSDQGCWIDGKQGRILLHQLPDSQANSRARCANACAEAGYTVSGTEYAVQCFCSDAIHNGGAETDEADCSTPCPGKPDETCGAGDRLSIVSKGRPQTYAPPAPVKKIGDWEYQGCAEDNINDQRTFFWQIFFNGIMTPEMCLDRCAEFGYHAAGLEYGQECYCGDPANMATRGATFRPESECNIVCAGNATVICGGLARLSTYFWTGTPFYSWDFPTDWRAGRYEFLVDGVTIPLITHETITGKVSFISKGATGPGNETGAYEFDPVTLEFRELHIKTDVFCAASVTLPDKAGRQLNVGGWAGEATYGTRLYWPDGAPGVPGTHDWEENVNVLHLQAGRWYPSVLMLTNGSVLVVGGLIGSNDAATPSIEILPYTGTPPLYMDWLDRTHPNNLYPFLCVLPGGGIFVQYWNEARILDPVTFETIRTLPDAPGAPNDPKGGRTYPLEGTAVLLPQRYPYTDPLGVLICGGSTEGPGNALDNCVSIYPEADEPRWQIERMPSFRVMSCMAPLPDGTYLIANGALHGIAGFGLGVGPNLNALLYDPAKPLGSRITVAANTTIARMYHSEAITLLDGRVLISGSNPEDGVNPEEYRVEVFLPPYLLAGKPRPTFTLEDRDWAYGQTGIPFTLGSPARNGDITVTLLGSVASTHGNSMGARTLMPRVSCRGTACTVDAPPTANICPPGWYQFFVLDGGIPAVGVYVRIGGDPGGIGNWPQGPDFTVPGV
ncbi:hypothetical protein VTH06DRAFT_475 [Thermothelomyces fergusii]